MSVRGLPGLISRLMQNKQACQPITWLTQKTN